MFSTTILEKKYILPPRRVVLCVHKYYVQIKRNTNVERNNITDECVEKTRVKYETNNFCFCETKTVVCNAWVYLKLCICTCYWWCWRFEETDRLHSCFPFFGCINYVRFQFCTGFYYMRCNVCNKIMKTGVNVVNDSFGNGEWHSVCKKIRLILKYFNKFSRHWNWN